MGSTSLVDVSREIISLFPVVRVPGHWPLFLLWLLGGSTTVKTSVLGGTFAPTFGQNNFNTGVTVTASISFAFGAPLSPLRTCGIWKCRITNSSFCLSPSCSSQQLGSNTSMNGTCSAGKRLSPMHLCQTSLCLPAAS